MDFSSPKPKRQSEPALPMINVVFLLLIFFLMSAQIVSSPPFDITLPSSEGAQFTQAEQRLHTNADGALAFGQSTGDAVWAELAKIETPEATPVLIQADAQLAASDLAQVLSRLSGMEFAQIQIATVPK